MAAPAPRSGRQYKSENGFSYMLDLQKFENKRIVLEDPKGFFSEVKKSPKYKSWKSLVENVDCGDTALKECRRGERTFKGNVFTKLLSYLSNSQQQKFVQNIKVLDPSWGYIKGGKNSIRSAKQRLGEKGFLEHLKKLRNSSEFSGFAGWHKRMKQENPKEYSKLQKERWLKLMNFLRTNPEVRQKAIKSIKAKYGEDHFSRLGLTSASIQGLGKREMLVEKEISNLGFEIEPHKTILGSNFDFVYKKENEIKAVEEVLSFKKKKSALFFEILVLNEKLERLKEKYEVPFFITTWYEKNLNYKIERFPLELLLWCLNKNMTPILMDDNFFKNTRKDFLLGVEHISEIRQHFRDNLQKRKQLLLNGATIQLKQPFDLLERNLHTSLEKVGLNPCGKKLLETKYGTYTVPDNYFTFNNTDYAVFASMNDSKGVIGSSAIIKEMISPEIKTIGIVLNSTRKRDYMISQKTLLNRYVDYFYDSIGGFESDLSGPLAQPGRED